MYINKKLPDTFKYFADQLHNDKSVKLQIETNIQFKSIISPYHEVFTIYKSENGLIKIDTELLSFLDMKETYLFAGLDNNVVYIFNNTNDFIGICLCSKFDLSELNVNIEL